MSSILVFTLLLVLITPGFSANPNDDEYVKSTGKTRDELIKSGQYIPIETFKSKSKSGEPAIIDFLDLPKRPNRTELLRREQERRGEGRSPGNQVKFILYTPRHKYMAGGSLLTFNAAHIRAAFWNDMANVKILIHGFLQNGNTEAMPGVVVSAYQASNTGVNIVVVDWGTLASGPLSYDCCAAPSTVPVGEAVGEFILFLQREGLIPNLNAVHIVGFSLGAHVAGVAGKYVRDRSGPISRITGLDPAGPSFEYYVDLGKRLDSSDASFVDVIHTNMGDLYPPKISLGTTLACGHVDFYPNGGASQPSCGGWMVFNDLIGQCSHEKAPLYFAETIRGKLHKGCQCQSWDAFTRGCGCPNPALMGEPCDRSSRGARYLYT